MHTTTKFLGATLLSLSLAVVPLALPGHAQEAGDTTTTTQTQDRDFDWGWLGLLGLIGLAGFAGKRSADHHSTSHQHNLNTRDLNEVNRPAGTRYQDSDPIDRSSTNRY